MPSLPIEIKPDFTYFDNLYQGQEEQYCEMLDLYLQEYSIYKRTISSAVVSGNLGEFRKAKHKIIYSLHLLGLDPIKSHLELVSQSLSELDRSELIEEARVLDEVFDVVMQLLERKRSDLQVV